MLYKNGWNLLKSTYPAFKFPLDFDVIRKEMELVKKDKGRS